MSTLNVESISHPTSGSNVTINGITPASTNSLGLRNLIINGAMQVAQRGTSSTASGYGTVDRFRAGYGGGDQTQSQVALTSGDPYDEGFRYIMRVTNTATATGAGNNRNITYKIEAQDIALSGWNYTSATSYITLSFWVRASVAQTYYVRFQTSDGTGQNYGSAFALSADTWTKVTKTIPGNSNITINSDNGTGLQVIFVPFDGTDFTDSGFTTDAWGTYSSSNRLPDMTNTWAGTTDATFDITGVQLEVGEVATPFEHRSYGDEFQKCLRYYQHYETNNSNSAYVAMGIAAGSTSARFCMALAAPMRTVPSVTSAGASADDQQAAPYSLSSPSITAGTITTLYLEFTSSGLTTGRPLQLLVGSGQSVSFSAEL